MTLEIQEPAPNLKYLAFMSSSFGKGLCKYNMIVVLFAS
jgi:hypothetical protein